jgi:two-component system, NarL family, response regulator LiaR
MVEESQLKKIKILLVDDHPLMLLALRGILEKQNNFEVIAEAKDGEMAVKLALELVPDVVIMDISIPVINGIEATRRIKKERPNVNILVLTIHDDEEHVFEILKAGADGYLIKNASTKEILYAINSIAAGDSVLSATIFKQTYKYFIKFPIKASVSGHREDLNTREIEILRLIAKGLSNKDIANILHLSIYTVKTYIAELFYKIKASSRTEAVIIGLRNSILTQDDIK